jgi:hypothetical protein
MRKNARSPTLQTVKMVETHIKNSSGTYTRTALWKKLPKKIMWQTYLEIIDYLKENQKIAQDKYEHLAYIWNPQLYEKFKKRPELIYDKKSQSFIPEQ